MFDAMTSHADIQNPIIIIIIDTALLFDLYNATVYNKSRDFKVYFKV